MTQARGDHGFTLAETLIALWVVSMAMACILAGFALLSRFDHDVRRQATTRRAADAATTSLRQAVNMGQAQSLTAFSGDAHRLQYACGEATGTQDNPRLCTLETPAGWQFKYVSETGIYQAWPQPDRDAPPQPLEALILQDPAGTTVSVVRIQVEQAWNCQFDTISRTCREESK